MKVTQRSERERFDKLYSDFKEREREEKQASCIDFVYDDNHNALTEIHERLLELEEERQDKETQEKKKKKKKNTLFIHGCLIRHIYNNYLKFKI